MRSTEAESGVTKEGGREGGREGGLTFPLSFMTAESGASEPDMMEICLPGGARGLRKGKRTAWVGVERGREEGEEGEERPSMEGVEERFSARVRPVMVRQSP